MSTPFHLPPQPPGPKAMRRVWPWILLAVLVLLLVVAIIGATPRPGTAPTAAPVAPSAAPTPAAAAAKPAGPATTITDGTYEVGVDMAAGRYKTPGPTSRGDLEMCYWGRNRDDSGQSIITNSILKGPGTVTVKAGEFFEVNGGCTWTKQ